LHLKVGTDICSVSRIEKAHVRFGDKFMERILTPDEITYALSKPKRIAETIAARFAVKEAVSKVLGTGWRGIDWKEVEVTRKRSGEPGIALYGRAAVRADMLGLKNFEVSISHEREYAVAFIVAYGE
jgi:holo-[acyl-carrier protein] synthase